MDDLVPRAAGQLGDTRACASCASASANRASRIASRHTTADPDVQREAIEATLAFKTFDLEAVRAQVMNWMQHRDPFVREAVKDWLAEWHRQMDSRATAGVR